MNPTFIAIYTKYEYRILTNHKNRYSRSYNFHNYQIQKNYTLEFSPVLHRVINFSTLKTTEHARTISLSESEPIQQFQLVNSK